jgi:hypothetical protein
MSHPPGLKVLVVRLSEVRRDLQPLLEPPAAADDDDLQTDKPIRALLILKPEPQPPRSVVSAAVRRRTRHYCWCRHSRCHCSRIHCCRSCRQWPAGGPAACGALCWCYWSHRTLHLLQHTVYVGKMAVTSLRKQPSHRYHWISD